MIVAAGRSSRFGGGSKVFYSIGGKPCVQWSVEAYAASLSVSQLIVVGQQPDRDSLLSIANSHCSGKAVCFAEGGSERQDSVAAGLSQLRADAELVSIHDAARPGVTPELIERVCERARAVGAAIAGVQSKDTLKEVGPDSRVRSTLDRSSIWQIATPQIFRRDLILAAYDAASRAGFRATDDAALVERLGQEVEVVEANEQIRKLTTKADAQALEAALGRGRTRIGFGYDVHRTEASRELWLGGVLFPEGPGLDGHSDADVVCHAAADAVLGAAACGDIGRLFPNTDERYRNIRSTLLLRAAADQVGQSGWKVTNIDITLIAERPKIAGRVNDMRRAIAEALGVGVDRVSMKATTAEGAGPTGEGLTMEAHAVALLEKA